MSNSLEINGHNWSEDDDGVWQREDGLLVVPGPDGGYFIAHPAGEPLSTVFTASLAAMMWATNIPAPTGEWVN
jgi:hypothetical protein